MQGLWRSLVLSRKKIWIDLDNSSYDPFFAPIVEKFKTKGRGVFLAARDSQRGVGRIGAIMTANILRKNIESSLEVHSRLMEACLPAMTVAAEALIAAYRSGRKALFFGNGGSAADAQHLAAEFLGRYLRERRPMPAVALDANTSAVTAIANDYGYEYVFSRQLQALAVAGDVAVGISTSGNSQSVLEALTIARKMGLYTIGLSGATGGRMRELVDVLIAAPSNETPRIQECHILVGHALCDAVEQAVAAAPAAVGASATIK
jgi:D-sedoheptulose 7-phosphate isomerase